MVTRRTVLKQGGCAALATAAPLLIHGAWAQATSLLVGQSAPTSGGSGYLINPTSVYWHTFTASQTGSATSLNVYVNSVNATTQIKLGIYNSAGTLLASGSISSPANGLNTTSIASTAITSGQTYSIAIQGNSYLGLADNGTTYGLADATHTFGSLPASLPSGSSYNTGIPSFWASGSSAGGSGLIQGAAFTITGSGFGMKSRALSPLVRDIGAASVNTLDAQWTGGEPSTSAAAYNIQNQTVGFAPTGATIGAPHSHVGKILAGAHANGTSASNGRDVSATVAITPPSFPYAVYVSWYNRCDPNFTFNLNPTNEGCGVEPDNNYKFFAFSGGTTDYPPTNQYWYIGLNDGCAGINNNSSQVYGEFGISQLNGIEDPDQNGHTVFWGSGSTLNPFCAANGWLKYEIEFQVTSATSGYVNVYQNGTQIMAYAGSTDAMSDPHRAITIGGYGRNYPAADNYRYFSDVYIDYTATGANRVAKVLIGNASTFSACTVREPQVVTSWASGSITFTFWQGALPSGTTGYIYVTTEGGAVIPVGSATIALSTGALLVGQNAPASGGSGYLINPSSVYWHTFTALQTGSATSLNVYVNSVNATTQIILGIYNSAGTLLASGSTSSPIVGLNTVSISSTAITSGQTYSIAIQGNSYLGLADDGTTYGLKDATHAFGALPSPLPSGSVYNTGIPSLWAAM